MHAQPIVVLAIDNNPATLRLVDYRLQIAQRAEFKVVTANMLATGIDKAKELQPDVILLDLGLPDSWGVETVQQMHAAVPHIPIVVFTNMNNTALVKDTVNYGAQDYIFKRNLQSSNLLERALLYAIERQQWLHAEEDNGVTADAVRQRKQQLEQLKAQVILEVSRELNTAITNFDHYLNLLTRGEPNDNEEHLGSLQQQVSLFKHLVNDVLGLAALDLTHKSELLQEVDLVALGRELVARYRPFTALFHWTLSLHTALPTCLVMAHTEQISHLLTNLLFNGLRYTAEGNVIVRIDLDGNEVRVQVADLGWGSVDSENMRLLPDSRSSHESAGESDGRWRMDLMYEIVSAHNGRLEVYNTGVLGKIYRLWLPYII